MKDKMNKTVLIYDGDILAYRASAAVEKRSIDVKHLPTGKVKTFDNRTQFKDYMKDRGKDWDKDGYVFEDKQEAEPIENCLSIMKKHIERINEELFADEYVVGLSGKSNFRDSLPLPSKYKGNREGGIRPTHLKAAKTYLWKHHNGVLADGFEADDFLIFKGYEELDKGNTPIIIGIDKDSYSSTGLSMYDFTKEEPKVELIPDLGYLADTGKKIDGRGFLWLCFQFCRGDPTDFYTPYELSGVKFGEKTAFKLLKDCKDKKQALEVVLGKYKEWYPEPVTYLDYSGTEHTKNYLDIFGMYFKCVQMMQTKDDPLDYEVFLTKHGVELNAK
jgi:hypothetical protein